MQSDMIGIFVIGEALSERGDRQDDSAPDMSLPCELGPPEPVVAIEVIR